MEALKALELNILDAHAKRVQPRALIYRIVNGLYLAHKHSSPRKVANPTTRCIPWDVFYSGGCRARGL